MPDHGMTLRTGVVHVVDDDAAVLRSLGQLLGMVGYTARTYTSAENFLAVCDTVEPGCVVADIRMPGMDGLALQQELRRRSLHLPMVVISGHADVALAVRAMKAGAVDLIEKPFSEEALLRAVNDALARRVSEADRRTASREAIALVARLTRREREVLGQLVGGWPNKVIAHALNISPRTVEIHRANVMDKLQCRSLADAVRIALAAGLDPGG